ncbi:hypothetical protein GLOTRDRAFT_111227 [Gloeophyllum trabeum ATCC 11539]|uniref:DUF6697 domain-containing protein n=1 Tax=Gloeophyllum trabeum (strain ATCC 11539 / FP-39264 / Madison 617) TaxID=670483 RepID=S7Q7H2_GLOTA|nr:uncharacterized protein GLOTRDRAFT_111227 [Gloeophyllum trabeum ATCC 11539]EPQ55403.1 hypothetical protein GLOTRDRAFT_111227 [Gloeophyllum trabeum ATCC 11539]
MPGLAFVLDLALTQKQGYSLFCLVDKPSNVVVYMGEYALRHVGDLSLDERDTLPSSIQEDLISRLLKTNKYQDHREARKALRTGEQVVHVLSLECFGFDEELHASLLNPEAYDSPHSDTDDGSEYEPQ